jgi:hypothetical protein
LSSQAEFIDRAFSPVQFCRSVGIQPDQWQQDVLTSGSKRQILCCGRQVGKSAIAGVSALWTCVYIPGSLVLVISASLRQSMEMFRSCLAMLVRTKDHLALTEETKQAITLANGSRLVCLPPSTETLRGYADVRLLILDESAQIDDSVYFSARPFLSVSNGKLMLLSSPNGATGFFYETWKNGGEEWQKVRVPSTECPRISPEFLAEEKQAMGDIWFRQEYLTEFISDGESVFPAKYVDAAFVDWLEPLFEEVRCSS